MFAIRYKLVNKALEIQVKYVILFNYQSLKKYYPYTSIKKLNESNKKVFISLSSQ